MRRMELSFSHRLYMLIGHSARVLSRGGMLEGGMSMLFFYIYMWFIGNEAQNLKK